MKTVKGAYLIIICLFLTACNLFNNSSQPPPEAIEGVLDLRDWDFERDGSINLDGEWAFFWRELLPPDQIKSPNQEQNVSVPDNWINYDIEGTTITPEGYATFHLIVYLPDTHQAYGLFNEGQGNAYSLWIDGHLSAQIGQVGTDPQAMTPEKNQSQFSSNHMEKRWRWSCRYQIFITARAASETTFCLV